MNKQTLTIAAALTAAATSAHAGIDRSGQDIGIIFEEGNYVELSFANVAPSIAGNNPFAGPISQSAVDYSTFGLGIKMQLNERLSFAVIYDEPYGADISYANTPIQIPLPTGAVPAMAEVNSSAYSGILRYQLGNGFSVHGGLRMQKLSGSIISGDGVLEAASGNELGGLVGVAYERPDIALRVALTYFSAVEHSLTGTHNGLPATATVEMPSAFNLDFQTGIAANTLLFGSIRHAQWDGKSLTSNSPVFGDVNWVNFVDDVTSYQLGVGRKLNDNWSVAASFSYTDGASEGTTLLAPAGATKSIGVGGTYTHENMKIQAGVQYSMIDDKVVTTAIGPTTFSGGDAVAFGLKVGFSF
ncbi:Long-chain fatty acid transport protein [Aliiroseovarius halocynthiae]|uniref:Transporter n=1 Tax=Aliiroseovarius halocynthiae TaxID=985055 RepID=A0A545SVX9_9RHOB|nr:hypothetical protein [Aliiroseovarius halocynthiae]TQV69114.1 hypothetical protein FIL88_05970 [Aliiroseovarius halocynthiae]SMR71871.1 Long-chain fatty acid transport protein [Aliiroseovarius halocynthiae]